MTAPPTLVTLVGDQPMPALLAARAVGASRTVLVATSRTHGAAERVAALVGGEVVQISEAYRVDTIEADLSRRLDAALPTSSFDLTGGTKPMSLALAALAARHRRPFVLLRSNGPDPVLSLYRFDDGAAVWQSDTKLPTLVSAAEYVRAHVGAFDETGFHCDPESDRLSVGGRYEQAVAHAIGAHSDEVLAGVRPVAGGGQLDLDLVVRCANHVGVVEVKAGGTEERRKAGLDQLAQATEPTAFGSHTRRLLVVQRPLNRALRELARSRRIRVVETPGYHARRGLAPDDLEAIARAMRGEFPPASA